MRNRDRLLMAMGKACDGSDRRDVILAASDLIMNVVRQQHPQLRDARRELQGVVDEMLKDLATHYDAAGRRKETRIVLPPMSEIIQTKN